MPLDRLAQAAAVGRIAPAPVHAAGMLNTDRAVRIDLDQMAPGWLRPLGLVHLEQRHKALAIRLQGQHGVAQGGAQIGRPPRAPSRPAWPKGPNGRTPPRCALS